MGVQRAHPLHAQRTHTAQPGESERARAPTCCPTKPAILRRDSMVHHTSRGLWRACALVLLLTGVQRAHHPLHAQRTHTAQPGESERAWAPTACCPTKPAILRRDSTVHHTSRALCRACALVLLLTGVQQAHPLHAQRTHTAQPGESE